ncbi:MAG: glycosyltransferase family 9 protein [Planctomycetota bacterium]|jgi:ADP-heptose:LPS heptosyltransferase
MQTEDDILNLLKEKGAQMARLAQRGVILQAGAIGDCILTLPLAEFMKDSLQLGGIDIIGHAEYIGFLPGRTCVDSVRSMEAMNLHRMFVKAKSFDLTDGDPLINAFSDYAWIVTFLGEPYSDFEQNLIFTANCSHSAEVITLSMKPPEDYPNHLTDYYRQQFLEECSLSSEPRQIERSACLIKATEADVNKGRDLLAEIQIVSSEKLLVIQPGSGGLHKCWHLDNFLAVAEELRSKGIDVVFLLGPAEQERLSEATINEINPVAKCLMDLSLTQVVELLSCSNAFLGNDSGISHLAAGMGVRTLVVFGPTNPAVYEPVGPAVTVFEGRGEAFADKPSKSLQQKILDVFMG